MGKFYLIVILFIAVILGVVTIFSQNKAPSPTQDLALQNPTIKPTGILQIPSQEEKQEKAASSPTPMNVVPQTLWVTNASSAAIKTVKGEIDVQFYPQDAPKTVTNFATLAKIGYYNNLTFHRVEPGFVIQGGDPSGNGTGGQSIYGPTFEDELNPNTQSYKDGYKEGVLAMANRGPNTNGSQFFIMLADNEDLPKNYTIFGKVTSGIDVVKQIAKGDKILTVVVQ
jgi:cyclophilin family peptidyl-prolyl cis-trans isomerase